MPDATFVLVVREPLAHAASLLAQHRRFSDPSDGFRRDYMRWLVHHEFGVDHRPFRFPGAPEGDPNTLGYWLSVWTACYAALEPVAEARTNVLVVPYEPLCGEPEVWRALGARLGLPPADPRELAVIVEANADDPVPDQARALHGRYLERARRWIENDASAAAR